MLMDQRGYLNLSAPDQILILGGTCMYVVLELVSIAI